MAQKVKTPKLVKCPVCGTMDYPAGEPGDKDWNLCGGCLDREHRAFVRRMARMGIYPYGKDYAAKIGK